MSPAVQTATGPVRPDALGRVLMHEHLVVLDVERDENYPWLGEPWDEERGRAHIVAELEALKTEGFETIVDVTVVPMGRQLRRVRDVSERSGVQIVVATGLYFFDSLPGPYAGLPPVNGADAIQAMLVHDIFEGAQDAGIRAGVIKCAVDRQGVTPDVDLVLRASARAHRRTGVPITTHTNAGAKTGLEQQRVFREEGVDPGRVVIGHCDDSTDLGYLERLIEGGSYLGMDRLGTNFEPPRAERIATIAALCERGYADRLVLAHDYPAFHNWGPTTGGLVPETFMPVPREVLPALAEHGVPPAQIEQMLVANPRRILEPCEPY
jgi:phosphotriesterase-related protein